MAALIACGPSAEEKAAKEKARQDSIAAVEKAKQDSIAAVEKAKQDSIAAVEQKKQDSIAAAEAKKGTNKGGTTKPKPKTDTKTTVDPNAGKLQKGKG